MLCFAPAQRGQERERVEASKNKIQERHEQLKAHEARLAEEKTVQLALIAAAEERGRELRLIAREEVQQVLTVSSCDRRR